MKTKMFDKDKGYKRMTYMINVIDVGISLNIIAFFFMIIDIVLSGSSNLSILFFLIIFILTVNLIILIIFKNGMNAIILHIKHLDFFSNS
tara:strand:+ start:461 stop:730 length:270 start_codon:yes stop_codon:yes gene_type:complete